MGDKWPMFLAALQSDSPTSIRLNPYKQIEAPSTSQVPWAVNGYYLNERPSFTFDPLFHAGTYYVQEASSMFLEQAVRQSTDLSQPLLALDLCAAPGGKSTHLLSILSQDSLLVSNEVIRQRANILAENITKWGNANSIVTNSDPKDFTSLPPIFDLIVVDAPCSGEGMFRKDNDAIGEWSANNVQLCSERQRRILSDVWGCLKNNGILIYSTCTFNKQENEENLQWLSTNCSFESVELDIPLDWNIEKTTLNGINGYRFYPHKVKGEGFFISVLRKTEGNETQLKPQKKNSIPFASKAEIQVLEGLLNHTEDTGFFKYADDISIFPKQYQAVLEAAKQHLRIVQFGTQIASIKRNGFVPLHGLAMSNHLNKNTYPTTEVELADAIQYLRRENLTAELFKDGWNIASYKGHPIGFINRIGNRTNNYYPKEWRIRSEWTGS